jgi:hypothetical protein
MARPRLKVLSRKRLLHSRVGAVPRTFYALALIFGYFAGVWHESARADVPRVAINDLVRRVAQAVADDAALEGAWLRVDAEDDGSGGQRPVFTRFFDADREADQAAAIDRIIARLVPIGESRIDSAKDVRLPYARLMAAIRIAISSQSRFEGCELLGGTYLENHDDESLVLVPRFRVARERQFDALLAECHKLMTSEPAWAAAKIGLDDRGGEQQVVLVPEPQGPDENDLVRAMADAIEKVAELRGSWVDVRLDDQGHPGVAPIIYVFNRVFDESRVGPQSVAMDALIRRLVPSGRFRVDAARDVQLPYDRLFASVREAISSQPRFDGCELIDGKYSGKHDGPPMLVPLFRVARKGQCTALLGECRKLMAGEPAWAAANIDLDVSGAEQQMRLVPEAMGPDENDLVRAIAAAIHEDPELRGSWVDVRLDDQGHPGVAPIIYVFNRVFDESRVGPQSVAMDALIRRLVPSGRHRVDKSRDVMLPLTPLLRDINRIMDLDPAFAGCFLSSASYRFSTVDDRWHLVPRGGIWQEKQEQLVLDLCERVMQSQSQWARRDIGGIADGEGELVVVKRNPAVAAGYFARAMHQFWQGDYRGASQALALASLEAPDNLEYRYWRAIAELAQGDQGLAEERLRLTVARFDVKRQTRAHHEIRQSIYRIQGPLRLALIRAEDKAMVARTTGSGKK